MNFQSLPLEMKESIFQNMPSRILMGIQRQLTPRQEEYHIIEALIENLITRILDLLDRTSPGGTVMLTDRVGLMVDEGNLQLWFYPTMEMKRQAKDIMIQAGRRFFDDLAQEHGVRPDVVNLQIEGQGPMSVHWVIQKETFTSEEGLRSLLRRILARVDVITPTGPESAGLSLV